MCDVRFFCYVSSHFALLMSLKEGLKGASNAGLFIGKYKVARVIKASLSSKEKRARWRAVWLSVNFKASSST